MLNRKTFLKNFTLVIFNILLIIINVLQLTCIGVGSGAFNLKKILKLFCVFLTFTFVIFTLPATDFYAADVPQSLEEQRKQLEENLEKVNKKLEELGKESEETEEYIKVLDEKIGYLNNQYTVAKQEAVEIGNKISDLEQSISKNEKNISAIKQDIINLESEYELLNRNFEQTYQLFAARMKAVYISGYQNSTLSFLLESGGLSQLYTRYEIISEISKHDSALLENVQNQTENIVETLNTLEQQRNDLENAQKTLAADQKSLKKEKIAFLKKQDDMDYQKSVIETQQLQANELLKKLHNQTQEYGEYRDITQEELDEIDAAIEVADKKYGNSTSDVTTTDKNNENNENTTTASQESKYINLTYPCPSFTTVTCAFGEYEGHTGCDFSTHQKVNQKIVASESGTVIVSADLTNEDGSYRSYGRYIVIRHNKTTSSGKTVYTLYAHNNSRVVKEGEYVEKGQLIAYSGSTGNSTGPHCHFEVRVGGSSQSYAVNPEIYLP